MKGFEEALKEADEILELPKGAKIPFRKIPACPEGFWMGSRGYGANEEPRHLVRMSAFWLASVPVTQEQFAEFRAEHKNHTEQKPWNPVEEVSYEDAAAFCHWAMQQPAWRVLNEKIFKAQGEFSDLTLAIPSEAQWEYACRAGSETEYWIGDGEEASREVAWFGEGFGSGSTHPVAQKLGNDFGLYDVHGNVLEWCRDAHEVDIYRRRVSAESDPEVLKSDHALRRLRGGSWVNSAAYCRSACRDMYRLGFRRRDLGFRLGLFPGLVEQVWPEAAPGAQTRQGGTPQNPTERRENAIVNETNFSPQSGDENSRVGRPSEDE